MAKLTVVMLAENGCTLADVRVAGHTHDNNAFAHIAGAPPLASSFHNSDRGSQMKKTQVLFAIVLLTVATPVARAAAPSVPATSPSNGAAIPKPCGCPGGATDGTSAWYGQGV